MTKTVQVPVDLLRKIKERLELGSATAAAQLAPVLTNATNSERWYQSRIFIGLAVAAAGWVGSKAGLVIGESDVRDLIEVISAAVNVGGLAYAWYGRVVGARKKPLGQ